MTFDQYLRFTKGTIFYDIEGEEYALKNIREISGGVIRFKDGSRLRISRVDKGSLIAAFNDYGQLFIDIAEGLHNEIL